MAILIDHSYGKSSVRLSKVSRKGARHEFFEAGVAIQLRGDFEDTYVTGSNAKVVATDTMKNTVYALAAQHDILSAEQFGLLLARHFLDNNAHVTAAEVTLEQAVWNRLAAVGATLGEHDHAFVGNGDELRLAHVVIDRTAARTSGGLSGLSLLKTTNSAFIGYLRDRYTTLPETTDRIFATTVEAWWDYETNPTEFNLAHAAARKAMIDAFAAHKSDSVQQTMLVMGEAALAACPQISELRLRLPNRHRIPVNLQPFGLENKNEIFVTTAEPFGDIRATIRRDAKEPRTK